jgi:hypothetical protein
MVHGLHSEARRRTPSRHFSTRQEAKQAEALSGTEASKHLAAMDEALEILDA